MDAARLVELLKKNPERTRWEYINFILEPYGEFQGRAILSQLYRLKDIEQQLGQTVEGVETIRLEHEQAQINQWLEGFSDGEIEEHLEGLENNDAAYWVQRLGREAAVDMVTRGRISKETLDRAILLNEDDYRAMTETCNTILQVIGNVTREVEDNMGLHPQLPEGEPQ